MSPVRPQNPNPVQRAILSCTKCSLHKLYNGPVPISLAQEGFLIIGEAPGAEEDQLGQPFLGKAGRYLRGKLKESNIPPGRTSFCNVISCRPHDNRTPSEHEQWKCRGNLLAQINVANPRVIIPVGATSLKALYPIGVLKNDRGRPLYYGRTDHNIWMVPTYHPAGVLRKKKDFEHLFLQDLLVASKILNTKPEFPDDCKVCKGPVYRYDIMGGAWCASHYKEVPRHIWQNELPGMEETFVVKSATTKPEHSNL